ncbi:MAG: outer-membrane lipoprotein carrier protein LolA [Alphaproteobacteria bacterium]|nr:outer-membrane lipoprotein carrier protein LolA [Alphaproteobacteria bacterium]
MRKIFSVCLSFLSINFVLNAEQLQPHAITLKEEDKILLSKIEQSLNNINTLKTEFRQISVTAQGQKSETKGLFLLSRIKGESVKFRFDYAPPQKIMILGVGNNIMYYDNEVDQKTPIDLKSTPAAFLAHETIRFNDDYIVTNLIKDDKDIKIRIVQKKDPGSGTVELNFEQSNLKLKGWRLTDAHGTDTIVNLLSQEHGVKLNPNDFKFFSPETGGKPKSLYP